MFVEGWQACCDDFAWQRGRAVGRRYGAWRAPGGRDVCFDFLDRARRNGGDVVLAAQADGIAADWDRVRRRYLNHVRQTPSATGPGTGKGNGDGTGAHDGKGQGGK